jgi:heat shock protein HslJ
MGDLDGDGFDEAVVLLGESSGGSGEFIHLAIVARRGMTAENVATAMIGDRIQVRGARLDSNRVILEVVQSGSQDAACCPGELAERTWTYADGALQPATTTVKGRLSVTMLAGAEWVLRWWDWDQPAPDSIEVTLNFLSGRIAGKAACNRYTASIEDGEMPGDVTVGHAASTRMACPEPLMNAETRFLRNLAQAKKVGFMATMLSVGYESEGAYKVMLFEGRAPSAAAAP